MLQCSSLRIHVTVGEIIGQWTFSLYSVDQCRQLGRRCVFRGADRVSEHMELSVVSDASLLHTQGCWCEPGRKGFLGSLDASCTCHAHASSIFILVSCQILSLSSLRAVGCSVPRRGTRVSDRGFVSRVSQAVVGGDVHKRCCMIRWISICWRCVWRRGSASCMRSFQLLQLSRVTGVGRSVRKFFR